MKAMDICCRLEYAKKMIDDIDFAQNLFRGYVEGTVDLGVPMESYMIPTELAIKADIFSRMYISFVGNLIFKLGFSRVKLNEVDVYEFLRGYTGQIDSKAGVSRHAKFIRKTGAYVRASHDNLIKSENKEKGK